MTYEQCVEFVKEAESAWIQWGKVMVPTLMSAAISAGSVLFVWKQTNRKEENLRKQSGARGLNAEPTIRNKLRKLVREGVSKSAVGYYRDLAAKVSGLSEFAELVKADVYEHTSVENFNRYAELKRIGFHYRDWLMAIIDDPNSWKAENEVDVQTRVAQLAFDVELRIKKYFEQCELEYPSGEPLSRT